MSRRAILLRAVNVGGATLPMAELKAIATDLGATDVATYIASGNLVAEVPGDPAAFDRAIERAVEQRFGFAREAISRTHDELVAALEAHPFEVEEPRFSYISFLLTAPTPQAVAEAAAVPTGDDRWQVIGRELHLRYAQGAGRADLKDAQLMRALGRVVGTARNLNTVRRLAEMTR